ncbi:MAG: hypothetical protein M3R24_06360 [Chloroflexota bacterium]|nr:hypothetical protein [Chloroflexota bacterium]
MADQIEAQRKSLIEVHVLGQEGDERTVTVNIHQKCSQLLHEGLKALYGQPTPNAAEYDLILHGRFIEPLTLSIGEAGIVDTATVSILPKTISRGQGEPRLYAA